MQWKFVDYGSLLVLHSDPENVCITRYIVDIQWRDVISQGK